MSVLQHVLLLLLIHATEQPDYPALTYAHPDFTLRPLRLRTTLWEALLQGIE
jgi:hypothetical protein